MALFDMGRATRRACGGIGFAIEAFPCVWQFTPSSDDELNGIQTLDTAAQSDVISAIGRLRHLRNFPPTSATLLSHSPQHSGFGTKTALLASLCRGIDSFHRLGLSSDDIRKATGRGGTSGVGIHTAFLGGVIWDGGHAQSDYRRFEPSSHVVPAAIPPLLARWEFPHQFEVLLFHMTKHRMSGAIELSFFQQTCPIDKDEVAATFLAVFHGLIPGLALPDLMLLRDALLEIHKTGFKSHELGAQPEEVRDLYNRLARWPRLAVGLSSLGPLVYAIFDRRDRDTIAAVEHASSGGMIPEFTSTVGRNQGFAIE